MTYFKTLLGQSAFTVITVIFPPQTFASYSRSTFSFLSHKDQRTITTRNYTVNMACSLRVLFKSRALTVLCLQDIPRMINYEAQCKMNQRKSSGWSGCEIKANLLSKSNGYTNLLLTTVLWNAWTLCINKRKGDRQNVLALNLSSLALSCTHIQQKCLLYFCWLWFSGVGRLLIFMIENSFRKWILRVGLDKEDLALLNDYIPAVTRIIQITYCMRGKSHLRSLWRID